MSAAIAGNDSMPKAAGATPPREHARDARDLLDQVVDALVGTTRGERPERTRWNSTCCAVLYAGGGAILSRLEWRLGGNLHGWPGRGSHQQRLLGWLPQRCHRLGRHRKSVCERQYHYAMRPMQPNFYASCPTFVPALPGESGVGPPSLPVRVRSPGSTKRPPLGSALRLHAPCRELARRADGARTCGRIRFPARCTVDASQAGRKVMRKHHAGRGFVEQVTDQGVTETGSGLFSRSFPSHRCDAKVSDAAGGRRYS
jgi:hypothetical protein